MLRRSAERVLRTARHLNRHEQTAKALDTGDVTVSHVELLAEAARRRDDLYAEHEAVLLDVVGTVEVQDFPVAVRRWIRSPTTSSPCANASFAFEGRCFTLSPTTYGSVVGGFLDPEASAVVSAVLDDVQPPDGAAHTWTRAEPMGRRLLDAALRASAWRRHARDVAGRWRRTGGFNGSRGGPACAGRAIARVCEIEGFGPIPRITAERMLCDSSVGRMVIGATSEVLDLGRRTRSISRRLRRARSCCAYGHCQFPGCRASATWCDVHHLVHWLLGGETNLDNCALLCRRHHVAVHEGGWKLARGPDGFTLAV